MSAQSLMKAAATQIFSVLLSLGSKPATDSVFPA